ncbi:MAG TPA: hypothetical protein VFG10_18875 [Saprospiraceae bacterium]|nr:hypothetical protein [Saprospiraceae bacterium]
MSSKSKPNIDHIAKDAYVIAGPASSVLVTFASHRDDCTNGTGTIRYQGNDVKIRNWGRQNDLPQFREQIIKENSIVPALLKTKRDIILGGGLYAYKEEFIADLDMKRNIVEVEMPAVAKEFFDKVEIDDYLSIQCSNLIMHSNKFMEAARNAKGHIDMIKAQKSRHTRAGIQNKKGRIDTYYLSGGWAARFQNTPLTTEERRVMAVPAYDSKSEQRSFIYHTGDDLISDDYYYEPFWWGSLDWIQLANVIPQFHQANIRNGYTIRYHIKVPKGYFYTAPVATAGDALKRAKDDEVAKKSAFMAKVNNLLAGAENAGRALFTDYDVNLQLMKEYPGIIIDAIAADLKDESMLKLYEKTLQAAISAQAIHPTIANIETQGRLSSGSEIRNAFLMYLAIHTPAPRRILLKDINLIKKINGWPTNIQYGFRDIEITKLDDNAKGSQPVAVTDQATAA